jgi:hypothetical protein
MYQDLREASDRPPRSEGVALDRKALPSAVQLARWTTLNVVAAITSERRSA